MCTQLMLIPIDDRPVPELIADGGSGWEAFPLQYQDIDNKRYYAVQDWLRGIALTDNAPQFWREFKKKLAKLNIQMSTPCLQLRYSAKDGKSYKMDFATAETLYQITQHMDTNTGIRNKILVYLAKSGVIVDEQRIAKIQEKIGPSKEVARLMNQGFDRQKAQDIVDKQNERTMLWKAVTAVWKERGAKGFDYPMLRNVWSMVKSGKSATEIKQELGLSASESSWDYDAEYSVVLDNIMGMLIQDLHKKNDSHGFDELARDIKFTQPVVESLKTTLEQIYSTKSLAIPDRKLKQLPMPKNS